MILFKRWLSNFNADIANDNTFEIFGYKSKLLEKNEAERANVTKKATIAVPLKYLSTFWRSLEKPLINCKVELKLK